MNFLETVICRSVHVFNQSFNDSKKNNKPAYLRSDLDPLLIIALMGFYLFVCVVFVHVFCFWWS